MILCENKTVIYRCREILSEWLSDVGLELRLDKTRLTHTLDPLLSEDGIAGFDFLGHHIQQYPAGKYRSARDHLGRSLGFKTLIVPSKQACKAHQAAIGKIIHRHIGSPQLALIKALNPVIRGWAVYYRASDAQNVGEFSQQDHLTYLKLRRWAKRRCHSTKAGHQKYWKTIGNNHWVFSSEADQPDSFRLLCHKEFSSSSNAFIKVKGDRSFYDGDWVYWSTRLGRHPELHSIKASLLKKQKGKCPWCDLYFRTGDVVEIDHIQPKSSGGKDSWQNRQLLHRHCHDAKTALDGSLKSQSDNDDVL